jgi:hypothetical protein
MKNSLIISYFLLLLLTILSALIAASFTISTILAATLMALAATKFVAVAFQFMDLKKAHPFWKSSLLISLIVLVVLIVSLI